MTKTFLKSPDQIDAFVEQAILSFPHLRYIIMQAYDQGDIDQLLDLLMAHEHGGNV